MKYSSVASTPEIAQAKINAQQLSDVSSVNADHLCLLELSHNFIS